jgi:hypothetical protein
MKGAKIIPYLLLFLIGGLFSGCATLVGGVIGASTAMHQEQPGTVISLEEVPELKKGRLITVYTIGGVRLEGRFERAMPIDLEDPLASIVLLRSGQHTHIPWHDVDKVELRRGLSETPIAVGVLTGLAIDAILFTRLMNSWTVDLSGMDW